MSYQFSDTVVEKEEVEKKEGNTLLREGRKYTCHREGGRQPVSSKQPRGCGEGVGKGGQKDGWRHLQQSG